MKRPSASSSPSNIRSKVKPKPDPKPQKTLRAVALSVPSQSFKSPNSLKSPKSPGSLASVKKATTPRKASPSASRPSKKVAPAEVGSIPKATGHQASAAGLPSATPTPRAQSKQAQLIELLETSSGASMVQMIELTGWQAHTVRGAISGTLRKRLGLNVQAQLEEGTRVYRLHRSKEGAGT